MMREICIWLTAMTALICACVKSSVNRIRRTSRSRALSEPSKCERVARSSAPAKPGSSTPSVSPSVTGLPLSCALAPCASSAAACAQGLQDILIALVNGRCDLPDRWLTVQRLGQLRGDSVDTHSELLQTVAGAPTSRDRGNDA